VVSEQQETKTLRFGVRMRATDRAYLRDLARGTGQTQADVVRDLVRSAALQQRAGAMREFVPRIVVDDLPLDAA